MYFSERNGYRKAIEKTSTITAQMYQLLFDCCDKYLVNLAWKYPLECIDNLGCYDIDRASLSTDLTFEIPDLYRDINGGIVSPLPFDTQEEYDQYALLDYIEFISQNCRDFMEVDYHKFFGHTHISFLETNDVFIQFRNEINKIFQKTGLQYVLTEEGFIERVTDIQEIILEAEALAMTVGEPGVEELLEEALRLYKNPHPLAHRDAMEKMWDAFERLKSYYCQTGLDKKKSVEKLVNNISNGNSDYYDLVEEEFSKLTKIGNSYRIRHHETDKIDIKDSTFYDYFFSRCLSIIILAIEHL